MTSRLVYSMQFFVLTIWQMKRWIKIITSLILSCCVFRSGFGCYAPKHWSKSKKLMLTLESWCLPVSVRRCYFYEIPIKFIKFQRNFKEILQNFAEFLIDFNYSTGQRVVAPKGWSKYTTVSYEKFDLLTYTLCNSQLFLS